MTDKKPERKITQTVLIFDQCGEAPLKFYLVEGDYTRLHGVYINSTENTQEQIDELNELIDDPSLLKTFTKFPRKAVVNGAAVITCGFYP